MCARGPRRCCLRRTAQVAWQRGHVRRSCCMPMQQHSVMRHPQTRSHRATRQTAQRLTSPGKTPAAPGAPTASAISSAGTSASSVLRFTWPALFTLPAHSCCTTSYSVPLRDNSARIPTSFHCCIIDLQPSDDAITDDQTPGAQRGKAGSGLRARRQTQNHAAALWCTRALCSQRSLGAEALRCPAVLRGSGRAPVGHGAERAARIGLQRRDVPGPRHVARHAVHLRPRLGRERSRGAGALAPTSRLNRRHCCTEPLA